MSFSRQLFLRVAKRRVCNKNFSTSTAFKQNLRNLAADYPNDQYIVESPYPKVEIPNVTIHDWIFSFCDKYAQLTAFECGVTGRKYTYEEIRKHSHNLNTALRKKLGLKKDEIVAIYLPNIPEFPIVTFGCFLAGLKITTLNPMYTSDEITRQLNDSQAKVLVTIPELFETARTATKLPIITIPNKSGASIPQGAINFNELINERLDVPEIHIDDTQATCMMPYSSGTTGLPKGVLLSHRNLVANLKQMGHKKINFFTAATSSHQDILPAVLPFFHIYGFNATMLSAMQYGVKMVTLPKFTPDSYIDAIKTHKPNLLVVVPPIVIFLTLHPGIEAKHLRYVDAMLSGAAPLGALDEEKFKQKANKPDMFVSQGYGLSETSPVICITPKRKDNPTGTIGHVVPNSQVKVVPVGKSVNEAVGPNEKGELIIRGPQVMKGYHNRPEETKNSFEDGWFKTGDMVYYDEKGYFFVTDRIKELIKVKGFQVPPAELEEIIRDHPDVSDAAVIGIPHMIHGEVPRAYVVAKQGKKIGEEDLAAFVASKVAPYKKLAGGIEIVDVIPKNASGKIMRRTLKLKYDEENK